MSSAKEDAQYLRELAPLLEEDEEQRVLEIAEHLENITPSEREGPTDATPMAYEASPPES